MMKKIVRGISIFLAVILSVGVFAACGESEGNADTDGSKGTTSASTSTSADDDSKAPSDDVGSDSENKVLTVEEIGELIEKSDNMRITVDMLMEMEMDVDGVSVYMKSDNRFEGEQDGDLVHEVESSTNTMVLDGEEDTESESVEIYRVKNGDKVTVYTKNSESGNWTTETEDADDEDSDLGDVFNSANYGAYDPSTGRYTMKDDAEAEFEGMTVNGGYLECKNGSYVLYMDLEMEGLIFKVTMTFSDFGKVSVKLPAEIAG